MSIEIHETANVSSLTDIELSKRGSKIFVGARSNIDSYVKIKSAGGNGDVIIGEDVTINSGCVIYIGNGLIIEDKVAIAANCVFAPVNHEFSNIDIPIIEQGFKESKGGIIIKEDVWIGAGCVLLDGAHIGKGTVIGAMSLVRGKIPPYSICHGNPLKINGRK